MEADVEDSWHAIARDADLDEVLACASLDERDLSAWARDCLAASGMPRNDAIHRSRLNQTFAYQILAGTRRASRDKLLQLAFGMQLGIHDASELLERGGACRLRPDCRRDLIVAYALHHGMGVEQCDDLLWEHGERTIMPGKPRGESRSQDRPQ
jgi:hypothetical protein